MAVLGRRSERVTPALGFRVGGPELGAQFEQVADNVGVSVLGSDIDRSPGKARGGSEVFWSRPGWGQRFDIEALRRGPPLDLLQVASLASIVDALWRIRKLKRRAHKSGS